MTNTNYTTKDYETIFKENIEDAQKYNLISDTENFAAKIDNIEDIENMYVLLLSTQSLSESKIFEALNDLYKSLDLDQAIGESLDNFGIYFNLQRPQAQRSLVGLTFSLEYIVNQDVTIPAGTEVWSDAGIVYYTDEDCTIIRGTTSNNTTAYSQTTGYDSRVAKNTLQNMEEIIVEGAKVSVNNPNNSTGGKNEATDDEYRQILKNWTSILEKGTKHAYEFYLDNFEGLDSYRLIPRWDGAGTIKVILDIPEEAQEIIFEKIKAGIRENVQKYEDDDIVIELVATHTITNINCTINTDIDEITPMSLPSKEQVALRVKNAIITYIDGGYRENGDYYTGLKIGEDFIPYKCGIFINEEVMEVKNVDFIEDSSFTIDDYEKAKAGVVVVNVE